jgi:hypothetical protein
MDLLRRPAPRYVYNDSPVGLFRLGIHHLQHISEKTLSSPAGAEFIRVHWSIR